MSKYYHPHQNTAIQRQTAVTAHFSSGQLLLFDFARQYYHAHLSTSPHEQALLNAIFKAIDDSALSRVTTDLNFVWLEFLVTGSTCNLKINVMQFFITSRKKYAKSV